MARWRQRLCWVVTLLGLSALTGCFGISQNPSYFPYLLPFGDVIPTHAKPPGFGYYADFDPRAKELVVRPLETTAQVGSQVVMLATVYDELKVPRRQRRIEWMVEGVGSLLEVDESGHTPGRGYKTSNKHGVSYTSWGEHRIARGNRGTGDDLMIRPGQTWCVLSSPVEGDTHLTTYAPGIYDWDKRRVMTTIRWVDVQWEFPPPSQAETGSTHSLVTRVYRFTDRKALAGYRVRYTLLDGGPGAVFVPNQTQTVEVVTDTSGLAEAKIRQTAPTSGVNRIAVEIIRAPDPTVPSATGVPIIKGETTVEWLAPNLVLEHSGPAVAAVGDTLTYTTTIKNTGRIKSAPISVYQFTPDGTEYIAPPAEQDRPGQAQGNVLVWGITELPPGQERTFRASFKTARPGRVRSVAAYESGAVRDQKEVLTDVVTPGLDVLIVAPEQGLVGATIPAKVIVRNVGGSPTENVEVRVELSGGLEERDQRSRKLSQVVPGLKAGDARELPLNLMGVLAGRQTITATATAGQLQKQATHQIDLRQPTLGFSIEPAKVTRAVGRPIDYTVTVENNGTAPLTGVVAMVALPPELEYVASSDKATRGDNNKFAWDVGVLQPNEKRAIRLTANAKASSRAAPVLAVASADGGVRVERRAEIDIIGVTALDAEFSPSANPVEVGKLYQYVLVLENKGSAAAKDVDVIIELPPEVEFAGEAGPTKGALDGQRVVFGRVPTMESGAKQQYIVQVRAKKPGDVRARASFRTSEEQSPLIRDAAVRIFEGLPAPVGPGGGAPRVDPVPPALPVMGTPTGNPVPGVTPRNAPPPIIPPDLPALPLPPG